MVAEESYQTTQANIPVEEEYSTPASVRQSSRRLARSLLRLGGSLASVPLAFLPDDSRRHMRSAGRSFQAAGHELTMGVASLLRAVAENIEEMAKELPEAKRKR
jgi:hypothetical protein